MSATEGTLYLRSGKWRWRISSTGRDEELTLTDCTNPVNMMRVRLPFSWRLLREDEFHALARCPEVRFWLDPDGVLWRVSAIGPGTPFDLPFTARHLVFDSEQTWSGIIPFADDEAVGDLTSEHLTALRARAFEFGGSRRRLRSFSGGRTA